jgi:hypothetical protein
MKRIIACTVPFMVSAALLGAGAQNQQIRNSLLRLQLLRQQIHSHLEQLRTGLEPEREALVRRKLSESLPDLQARALDLRQAERKFGLSLPPVPWGKLPANSKIGNLINQVESTIDDLIASFMKLSVEDPSGSQDFLPLTSAIITLAEKIEKELSESHKPDLVVCLSWGASVPLIYQDKWIYVRVENVGQAPAPASTLRVYVQQNDAQYIPVYALNPNRVFYWSRKFHWRTCGIKLVKAWADYNGNVVESVENNNMMEFELLVSCGIGTPIQSIPTGCSYAKTPKN